MCQEQRQEERACPDWRANEGPSRVFRIGCRRGAADMGGLRTMWLFSRAASRSSRSGAFMNRENKSYSSACKLPCLIALVRERAVGPSLRHLIDPLPLRRRCSHDCRGDSTKPKGFHRAEAPVRLRHVREEASWRDTGQRSADCKAALLAEQKVVKLQRKDSITAGCKCASVHVAL